MVRNSEADKTVPVVTSIGITHCWLLSRLVGFYEPYPDIDLQLTTRDSTTNLDPQGADVAIVFGHDDLPGIEINNIFRGTMIPVCHPNLFPENGLFAPEELASQPLLH